MAQHLPHLGHGSEIGIEFALPITVVSSTLRASLGGAGVAGPSFSRSDAAGASRPWQRSWRWHGDGMAQRSRSSSAQVAPQRWPLIQDQAAAGPWPLLVVVHGHGGGAVPAVLQSLLDELAQARGAAVWVQALTAEPLELPPRQKLLLVPLLLTPGSHVRVDVPAIRQRLRGLGHQVMALPFLGAWQPWLQHLRQLGCDAESQVVVHHPLRPGIAERYLHVLSQALALPLRSADTCDAELDRVLPLALAPNRMTAHLSAQQEGGLALLEHPATRQFLFELLLDLP